MSQNCTYLYVVSFTVGAESGLALIAAPTERDAIQVLRSSGSRSACSKGYTIIQTRDIGMTAACNFGILMESFVNAIEAFEAITSVANYMKGSKGDKGDKGDVGPMLFDAVNISVGEGTGKPSVDFNIEELPSGSSVLNIIFDGLKGAKGDTGVSIANVRQTLISDEDEGQNEITITLDNGTESKIYVKNGRAGVTEATATVDAIHGVPSVVTYLEDGVLSFAFSGLKGMQGNPGVNNATMLVVTSLPNPPSAETAQKIYLVYNEQTGVYDRYFTQYDGQNYGWVQAGSMTVNLEDYQRKDDEVWLTQEEFDALEIKDITKVYNIYEESDEP